MAMMLLSHHQRGASEKGSGRSGHKMTDRRSWAASDIGASSEIPAITAAVEARLPTECLPCRAMAPSLIGLRSAPPD